MLLLFLSVLICDDLECSIKRACGCNRCGALNRVGAPMSANDGALAASVTTFLKGLDSAMTSEKFALRDVPVLL